jgi:CspA family cold shock protein
LQSDLIVEGQRRYGFQKVGKKYINCMIIRKMYLCGLINQFNTMNKGIVKFFNESKGFGFIKDESSGKEYFVHVSGLTEKVKENDNVSFDLIEGRKGLNAVNVRKA